MSRILYLHGFASSPFGAKASALAERLQPEDVELLRPDLNQPSFRYLDFDAIVAHAREAFEQSEPQLIVGSSLGSLVALALAGHGARVPLILIAPALGIADRWREKTPPGDPVLAFHHGEGRELPIHRAFFETMMNVHIDDTPPPQRVVAIMGTLDETVPFASVEKRWKEWEASGRLEPTSRFIEVPGGDHGLTAHVDLIARVILENL